MADPLEILRNRPLEVVGRLTDASNATFLCDLMSDEPSEGAAGVRCVYKPIRGERPLDDFPSRTLARREVAAFALSRVTSWDVVPPTVMRDGPFGRGMVQLWIDIDPKVDVVDMVVSSDERLRQLCVFDIMANNADRKGSHILPTTDGHIYGVDHGICFAVEPKLRTVLWGWRGLTLTADELTVVRSICDGLEGSLGEELGEWISPAELSATQRRVESLLASGRFPQPDPLRPAVPWPPF